jgi:16S rRNA (guanine527-N7)-methyltransferase
MDIGSRKWRRIIQTGVDELGVGIDNGAIGRFTRHAELLVQWNRVTNLTAVTAPDQIAVKHILDSIALAPLLPKDARLLDIGSGGGFPGIPLKICRPGISVLLIDAVRKKVSFLRHVIRTLDLPDINALHLRAESPPETLRATFTDVVSRAAADLTDYLQTARAWLSDGGVVWALKGPSGETEITALLSRYGSEIDVEVTGYRLPFGGGDRRIIGIRSR